MTQTASPRLTLSTRRELLQMKVPFRISGRVFDLIPVLRVELSASGCAGRGEAAGVYYTNETADTLQAQVEHVRGEIEAGISHASLRTLLPSGGARNAVDCALWELESFLHRQPVWRLAGMSPPQPMRTTLTLGADLPQAMAQQARVDLRDAGALKLKLTGDVVDDIARLRAVRDARPDAWISVDANQGYAPDTIDRLLPELVLNDVALLEQPFARGREDDMRGIQFPVPTAADESCLDLSELDRAATLFDAVNIKLDKCGGLAEALLMARRARELGLKVMVGNMGGSSLAIAPALVLGPACEIVDLDGPWFLKKDVHPGVLYSKGSVSAPDGVWGYRPGPPT
jgi:L-alanine-DL-glutamate epimerase-like enolase superfamily enzyme